MTTEQKVLDEDFGSMDLHDVYKKYIYVYQSALPGIRKAKDLLGRVIGVVNIAIDRQEITPEILNEKNLNRWLSNGQANINLMK